MPQHDVTRDSGLATDSRARHRFRRTQQLWTTKSNRSKRHAPATNTVGMFSTRWILYSHNFMERKSTPVGFLKDVKLSGPLWQVLRAWEHGGSTNRASDSSTFVRSLRLCIHHILSWFPAFPVVSFSLILYSGCLNCSLPNLLDWRRALDPNIVLVSLKWEKRKKVLDSANGHMLVVEETGFRRKWFFHA
jgi:hypothetical protein